MNLTLSRTKRVDWPRMAENLRRLGMSMREVADDLGVAREGLANWMGEEACGEPAFWTGAKLIELWCRRTGLQWTDLPTRNVAPSVAQVLRESA
jgi:hypothetical protein